MTDSPKPAYSSSDLQYALAYNFGAEWNTLSPVEQLCVALDAIDVDDVQQYVRRIGRGNLISYAQTQLVRFGQSHARRRAEGGR